MNKSIPKHCKEAGLGLVSAIFVISVLALIAAGMAAMVASSAKNNSQQILSIRANSAALSALDIQLTKMVGRNSCISSEQEIAFNTSGLYECQVNIKCSAITYQAKHYINIESQASCGSGSDLAIRSVRKRLLK